MPAPSRKANGGAPGTAKLADNGVFDIEPNRHA
jgi:hypothetical protein